MSCELDNEWPLADWLTCCNTHDVRFPKGTLCPVAVLTKQRDEARALLKQVNIVINHAAQIIEDEAQKEAGAVCDTVWVNDGLTLVEYLDGMGTTIRTFFATHGPTDSEEGE